MEKKKIIKEVIDIAFHRNGVCGDPFYIIKFTYFEEPDVMIGIVFPTPATVAVFSLDKLSRGVIEFTQNSYRGDVFEFELRDIIKAREAEL